MKLLFVLMLCAFAAAAPNAEQRQVLKLDLSDTSPDDRSILVNILISQLFAYIRLVINNGSAIFGFPPLDPLQLDDFHLVIPAGLINLDLQLKDVLVTGVGGFVVHRSNLQLRDLTFEIDISVPRLLIRAGHYDLDGDLFNAIPVYGKGQAQFEVESFRFRALLHLRQSEDEKSVLIDRIENPSFEIPTFKSNLDGAIGGGDIDAIVNAVIEEVIIDYLNRFQRAIALGVSQAIVFVINPILDQLDTWRFIAPLIPS